MSTSRKSVVITVLVLAIGAVLLLMWDSKTVQHGESPAESTSVSTTETKQGPTRRGEPRRPMRVVSAASQELPEAPTGRFSGSVFSTESGEVVPAAELVFIHAGVAETVLAGTDGRFVFTPSALGDYQLAMVTAEEFLPYAPQWEHSPITLVARPRLSVEGISIYLTPAHTYLGVVVDRSGTPVAGAAVSVLGADEAGADPIETDANGEFSFQARSLAMLRAGDDELVGYGRVNQAVQAGQRLRIVIGAGHRVRGPHGEHEGTDEEEAQGTASITGQVLGRGGDPVAAFNVQVLALRGMSQAAVAEKAVFDGTGGFRIDELVPGSYRVVVAAAGYSMTAVAAEAAEGGGAPVTITLGKGAVVSGIVVDALSEEPIEGAKISVESRFGGGSSARPMVSSVVTNSDGEFRISGLQAGRRSIVVAALGYHSQIVPGLEIEDEAAVGPLTIELTVVAEGERPGLELAGIGAMLGVQEDELRVRGVIAGGGAEAAGLVAGDVILSIDGRSVPELGFDDAIQAIRGPAGSEVRLRVQRVDTQVELVATRGAIRS